MTRCSRWLFFPIAALFIWPVFVSAANVGLTIQPVKVSHTLNPGERTSGQISLTNAGDVRARVDIKVEDFIPLAGGEGIQFVGRTEGVTTVRDWVTLGGKESFSLNPGQSTSVSYTINAPAGAEPGSHFGVALFKASLPDEVGQFKVAAQVGMLIFVTVPGDRLQQGKLLEFSGPRFVQRGPVPFHLKFENTGTVHFEPKGEIVIQNIFGKTIGRVPVAGQVVLPTGVKDWIVSWPAAGMLFGVYRATITITDGLGETLTSRSTTFTAVPVFYGLVFVVAVVAIYFLLRWLRRRVQINISLK